jgi:DNA-binding NarL/FixJ family response regulator
MSARRDVALIVDVDDEFRRALRTSLTSDFSFHEVVETQSVDDALELLGAGRSFRIAVFDLFTLGEQSAHNLRSLRAGFPSMPIAIVSTSTARRDILAALEAGVHGYIPKASGMRVTGAGLRAVLDGSIYVPSSIAMLGEVLHLVVEGKSNKEIARHLNLAEGTIKVHMSALFRGLGVTSRSAAAALGARIGARVEQQSARR